MLELEVSVDFQGIETLRLYKSSEGVLQVVCRLCGAMVFYSTEEAVWIRDRSVN